MRTLRVWIWFLIAFAAACAVTSTLVPERVAPRPTLNHVVHADNELECADCHDPEGTGTPKPASVEFCQECHDDLAEESDSVRKYFDTIRKDDTEYEIPRSRYMNDLAFTHEAHVSYGAECAVCHGETRETAFERPKPLVLKAICMDCHQREPTAKTDCVVCHTQTRKDKKPASHDAAFRKAHGAAAPNGWTRNTGDWRHGTGGTCALCHAVPNDCNDCHAVTRPESHRLVSFRTRHGGGHTDARDGLFEGTSCALCHQELGCVRCHQVEKPRDHTPTFERRFHGLKAEIDRERCEVCHKQDFCMVCHQTARPVSHRGNFSSGSQSHCIHCHEPLQSNGCYACHKNTLGHLQAPALPPGPPHAGARDCRTCHRRLRHFDDGLSCRRCHK